MGNEFFGFSQDAFEQFARALCMAVLGPGTVVFGDGPDGGREGIFRGPVPYPHPPAQLWSGYGVLQAKCKAKPEGTEKDQAWALKQLRDELDKFVASEKRQPKPEYYVFITNVELSAAGGGWDAGDKLADSYYGQLPLKGHAIWDANQLRGLVDRYHEIRRRFTAYLTPGDVLAALIQDIEQRRPNATRILSTYLDRTLRADVASKLQQAGDQADTNLSLARLFFDLPAAVGPEFAPSDESDETDESGNLLPGVLDELLRFGSLKLDAEAVRDERAAKPGAPPPVWPPAYLLLGGPGSGKSTLGQILAQIHRAALLDRRDPTRVLPATRASVAEIRTLCESERLPWPPTPRYPFRVELNRFAKELASDGPDRVRSLADYLRSLIRGNDELTHADLIDWLAAYPWLLILDGLDEVPAASNRSAVIGAVQDFLAEAVEARADLCVIATSRPNSYLDEFAAWKPRARHLQPLSRRRALAYIRRYAAARFGADEERADDLVSALTRASENPLTAQLMSSPLQATFMATVTAARGSPGDSRWKLFDDYYRTIYAREQQKAVPPYARTLGDHQGVIDQLHHDVGFLLQLRGETAADQGVALSSDEFSRIVRRYVTDDGHDGEDCEALVGSITSAAQERLVFLTSRVVGELSFDVRSLQEYMAAERLMSLAAGGETEPVKERLRRIAPAPYWRNVFLFAADKCFASPQYAGLRETLRVLAVDLNGDPDPLLKYTRAGSGLALDMLLNTGAAGKPQPARHLAQIALERLSDPSVWDEDGQLALAYRPSLADAYRAAIESRVGLANPRHTFKAWSLLVQLIAENVSWAKELADRHWPSSTDVRVDVLRHLVRRQSHMGWVANHVEQCLPDVPLQTAHQLVEPEWPAIGDYTRAVGDLYQDPPTPTVTLRGTDGLPFGYGLGLPVLQGAHEKVRECFDLVLRLKWRHPSWAAMQSAASFARNPNRSTLSTAIREHSDDLYSSGVWRLYQQVPWPLLACLKACDGQMDRLTLSTQVAAGALGDTDDWLAAERRWCDSGISLNDLLFYPQPPLPFDHTVRDIGFPIQATTWWVVRQGDEPRRLVEVVSQLIETAPTAANARLVWFVMRNRHTAPLLAEVLGPEVLRNAVAVSRLPVGADFLPPHPPADNLPEWIDYCDWLGRVARPLSRSIRSASSWVGVLQRAVSEQPNRWGLVRLLAWSVSSGEIIPGPLPAWLHSNLTEYTQYRTEVLVLHLTQPNLTTAEAKRVADEAVSLFDANGESDASTLIFETARLHSPRLPAISHFLVRLCDRSSIEADAMRGRCIDLLRDALRRRPSDLHSPVALERLQLPRGELEPSQESFL